MSDSENGIRHSIILFCFGTFFFWFSLYVFVPILPVYTTHLGASLTVTGIVVGAYGVTQLLLRIPLGIWSDLKGSRKPFIIAGFIITSAGILGLGLSPNAWYLVAARSITGVGAATWVAFVVLFSSFFPAAGITRAMGIITFVLGLAQVLSTYAGGIIAENFGWKAPFFIGAAVALVGMLCMIKVREKPGYPSQRITPKKLLSIGMVPLLLVVSSLSALNMFACYATIFGFLPIYAARIGASKAELGSLTTTMFACYTLAVLSIALISQRVSPRMIVVAGTILLSISYVLVPFVHQVPKLYLVPALVGIGSGLTYPVLMGLSVNSVSDSEKATAMGIFQAVYSLGMLSGPPLAGICAESFGLESVFGLATAISIISMIAALLAIPRK